MLHDDFVVVRFTLSDRNCASSKSWQCCKTFNPMKSPLLLLTLCFGFLSFAQSDIDNSDSTSKSSKRENVKDRTNEVSLEFLDFADGRFIPAHERSFGKQWSAKIGANPNSKEVIVNLSDLDGEKLSM